MSPVRPRSPAPRNDMDKDKQENFYRFKVNKGIDKYQFFFCNRMNYAYKNFTDAPEWLVGYEVITTHTLVKRMRDRITVYDDSSRAPRRYDSLSDFIEVCLIEKLAEIG